ncbi:hypothetical protein SAMN02746098_00178 [Desulfosporosinus lacus DSM 15449]|uniref:Tight adherence protein C n=1 Tax=Desulfosporosinus lacus DSM 15449 TaxID=1121420 RepID=A0A1M5Q8Y0_9FIRM|nr:hypothetical protein SAMN02746098_00178 [Desulfosporosinus lacus DSM 15449]
MSALVILFACLISGGVYFLLTAQLDLPSHAATKTILSYKKQGVNKPKATETMIWQLAVKLSPWIRLNEYKQRRLKASLKSTGIQYTPETYMAQAIVKAGCCLLGTIPALLIFPPIALGLIVLAIYVYFYEVQRVDRLLKKKREAIENELPRFVLNVEQELKASRNVVSILDKHRKKAGKGLEKELEITVADMKTGNQELALSKLDARVGSSMLSEVVRGLIGVIRGDDNVLYFQRLAHGFKQIEFQKLKMIAQKRPGQMRKYSLALLGCFIMVFVIAIGMHLVTATGEMF